MTDIEQFEQRIKACLREARQQPRWPAGEVEQYMHEFRSRRQQFEVLAHRLLDGIVRPRLEKLQAFFPNASVTDPGTNDRCICWFGYCDRFPASVKVELAIEHDERIEHVHVCYELYVVPVFMKYDSHDKLALPLGAVDDSQVTIWVEEKLLEFLRTYLQIDRGPEELNEDVVVDPVCGMRIRRSESIAQLDYRGHPYHFCGEECRDRFSESPLRYVRFTTH